MPEILNIERLKDAELDKLARSADLGDALAAVKHLERRASPLRAKLYDDLLRSPRAATKVKRTVASLCGKEALQPNRELLKLALHDHDEVVVRNAARGLGLIGGVAELSVLEALRRPADPSAAAAVEFGKCLISYRNRLGKHRLAVPNPRALVGVRGGFELVDKGAADGLEALKEARVDLPGLGLANHGAASLDCRGVRLVLAFTDDFPAKDAIESLPSKDARPLVLMHSGLSTGGFTLAQHFVTQPGAGGRIELLGARPGGELTYAGAVTLARDGVHFEIRSLGTRYAAAIDFAGIYSPATGAWKFTRKQSSEQAARPSKARPTATTI